MRRTLPNFVCEQTTERHRPYSTRRGDPDFRTDILLDTISATVTYEDGANHYDDIRVSDQAVSGEMFDIAGLTSMGEFGSDLLSLFLAENAASFRFREYTKTLEANAIVFDFYIPAAANHSWIYREKNASTRPGLEGSLWLDRNTNAVLRLDLGISDIDFHFDTQRASRTTVYRDVDFPQAGHFRLPVRSEATVCTRDQMCTRNTTEWKNCKRFTGKARIVDKIE